MKRIVLAAASAVVGLVLFAATVHSLRAETGGGPTGGDCYYIMYTCNYGESNAYWDGCDPNAPEGEVPSSIASKLCTAYHPS